MTHTAYGTYCKTTFGEEVATLPKVPIATASPPTAPEASCILAGSSKTSRKGYTQPVWAHTRRQTRERTSGSWLVAGVHTQSCSELHTETHTHRSAALLGCQAHAQTSRASPASSRTPGRCAQGTADQRRAEPQELPPADGAAVPHAQAAVGCSTHAMDHTRRWCVPSLVCVRAGISFSKDCHSIIHQLRVRHTGTPGIAGQSCQPNVSVETKAA
eukprot:363901-Chlamydomonas_euryale.AAC.41